MDILRTLNELRPGNSISFREECEETLSNIIWISQTTYTPNEYNDIGDTSNLIFNQEANVYTVSPFSIPTQQECEDYWNNHLKIKIANGQLRIKRDQLLIKSDMYSLPDYPHATEEVKQAWLDYRQALRDLPSNTTDPSNPVWPIAPN